MRHALSLRRLMLRLNGETVKKNYLAELNKSFSVIVYVSSMPFL